MLEVRYVLNLVQTLVNGMPMTGRGSPHILTCTVPRWLKTPSMIQFNSVILAALVV